MAVESVQAEWGAVRLAAWMEEARRPRSGRNGGFGTVRGWNREVQAEDGAGWGSGRGQWTVAVPGFWTRT